MPAMLADLKAQEAGTLTGFGFYKLSLIFGGWKRRGRWERKNRGETGREQFNAVAVRFCN